ncbi:MAG: CDP-alcohol phosphatidyltransferase family protein [Bacteroidota bacterium]
MKQIPNIFTLINLIFGCIAIVLILQTGETIVLLDNNGVTQVTLPEKIWQGSLFIFGAAIVDFLDGFLARLLKANSEKGKQLDSLCDVVSFGVAPGMILYQLLRIGYANEAGGLDVSMLALLPAFIFSGAVAWRLAKFNISTNQSYSFSGVPSPAAGLLVASFPLIIWYQYFSLQHLFINVWLLYAVILVVSYLMLSNHTFLAMKFTNYSLKSNRLTYLLLAASILAIIFLQWLAVPIIFVLYVIVSLVAGRSEAVMPGVEKEMIDVTV